MSSSKKIVGLEFGNYSIKSAQLHGVSKKKSYLEKFSDFSCPRGFDPDGRIQDVEAVAASLKRLWLAAGYSTKHVALGVGNSQTFIRELTIPKVAKSKLKSALPELAADLLPQATDDLILDFYPIREVDVEGEKKVDGLLVAAEKLSIENMVAAVEQAGLKVKSIDLVPFAISRYFAPRVSNDETVALVHAANGAVTVIVSRKNVPLFVRVIPLSSPKKAGAASSNEQEDAQTLLFAKASEVSNDGDQDFDLGVKISQLLTSAGSRGIVLRGVSDTIQYFNQAHPADAISAIQLTGLNLNQGTFPKELADTTGMEIKALLVSPIGHKKNVATLVDNLDTADELTGAIALASREVE